MTIDEMYELYERARTECYRLHVEVDRLRLFMSYGNLMKLKSDIHTCRQLSHPDYKLWGVPYTVTSGGELFQFVITT